MAGLSFAARDRIPARGRFSATIIVHGRRPTQPAGWLTLGARAREDFALHSRWLRLRRRLADWVAQLRGGGSACAVDGRFYSESGMRPYRLYRPGLWYPGARPLVVMLHGCRQNPPDFAAGTLMQARGAGRGCFVLFPGQDRRSNRLGCWNWFDELHQKRDRGEPAILASLIRAVIAANRIDPNRVYVAGLSAGGAMAAILAATHPELFAAVGIHSGLPHAAARSALSALVVMKRGPGRGRMRTATKPCEALPLIVFHGDQDDTVHPGNGEELIVRTRFLLPGSAAEAATERTRTVEGRVPGGRAWTRTLHQDSEGHCHAEHWVIHGSGHAWSGGHPAGSYTDPHGPDASREMLRFFRQHRRQSLTPRSSDARPAFVRQAPSDVLGPQHPPQPARPLRRR